jgi:hypothetical protein
LMSNPSPIIFEMAVMSRSSKTRRTSRKLHELIRRNSTSFRLTGLRGIYRSFSTCFRFTQHMLVVIVLMFGLGR